jgi:antibiotic biosynthesis monooxygenase (ABM) superfamily enzyme
MTSVMKRTETGLGVTIVTQTRVLPGKEEAFAEWQRGMSEAIAKHAGFLQQTLIPPSPPTQQDWVILQRFTDSEAATAWLSSVTRLERVTQVQPLLANPDDVHLVQDSGAGVLPAPVSAVIATRIKPGTEAAFRAWEQKIASVQSKAKGFQGYRFEPPVHGVQEDWLAILRFDSEANLQAWLDSPERQKLLEEAAPLIDEFHARIARTGFDQWFPSSAGQTAPAWKQNMLVLLMLYPVVALFGVFVQTPYLLRWAGLPFMTALFLGNIVSVTLTSYLVPWISTRLSWWLQPGGANRRKLDLAGTGLVVFLYALMVAVFTRFF